MQKLITASASLVIDFADGFDEYILTFGSASGNLQSVVTFLNAEFGAKKRVFVQVVGTGGWAISSWSGATCDCVGSRTSASRDRLGFIDIFALGATASSVRARCSF